MTMQLIMRRAVRTIVLGCLLAFALVGCETARKPEQVAKPPAGVATLELDPELSLLAIDGETKAAAPGRIYQVAEGKRQLRIAIQHPLPKGGGSSGSAEGLAEVSFEARAGSAYRLVYAANRSTGAGFSQMATGVSLFGDGARCSPINARQWICP